MKLKIGQVKVNITPPVGIEICGHERGASVGIRRDLYATAVVFQLKNLKCCIIMADLVGFRKDFSKEVSLIIEKEIGIEKKNVVLCASHSHSGPEIIFFEDKMHSAYEETLKWKLAGVVRLANRNLKKAKIGIGRGHVDINVNRRLEKDGKIQFLPNIKGVCDKEVIVVRIDQDNKIRGIITNYACHPTATTGDIVEIDSDYPGASREFVEAHFAGKVINMFTLGCCGDIRLKSYDREGNWKQPDARTLTKMGNSLGEEVIRISKKIKTKAADGLKIISSQLRLPLDRNKFSRKEIKKQLVDRKAYFRDRKNMMNRPQKTSYRRSIDSFRKALKIIDSGKGAGSDVLDLHLICVGNIVFVCLPSEIFTEIGMQIKNLSSKYHLIPISICNVMSPYICTKEACLKGGYEPDASYLFYGYPFPYSDDCEAIILKKIRLLLNKLTATK